MKSKLPEIEKALDALKLFKEGKDSDYEVYFIKLD